MLFSVLHGLRSLYLQRAKSQSATERVAWSTSAKGGGPERCVYGYIASALFASHVSAGAALLVREESSFEPVHSSTMKASLTNGNRVILSIPVLYRSYGVVFPRLCSSLPWPDSSKGKRTGAFSPLLLLSGAH